ncbi:EVE domain-containing protein [Shewanella sp. JM162201]|uniref:EVE domain-containing protein n=1 Tax=Shewanella jiangmenensis TaxID=2837387 RepID=A0ABS5V5F6_9GAMM|nr:EVE domain-containing protein [Shewanella jiangmenensis]MBT1445680.1 EVE domain-containing protein [Shewanella jiangmenensis]
MNYWLMKSEPDEFSIDDLARRPNQTEGWHGIRNYQARNFMRDAMQIGDRVLFYHSSCKVPAVVGIAEIVSDIYPDASAWDPESPYFDPKSPQDSPRWLQRDIRFIKRFTRPVTLSAIKAHPGLADMLLVQKGSRLSIQPVSEAHWQLIHHMAGESL